jgi:hypothetical protein
VYARVPNFAAGSGRLSRARPISTPFRKTRIRWSALLITIEIGPLGDASSVHRSVWVGPSRGTSSSAQPELKVPIERGWRRSWSGECWSAMTTVMPIGEISNSRSANWVGRCTQPCDDG